MNLQENTCRPERGRVHQAEEGHISHSEERHMFGWDIIRSKYCRQLLIKLDILIYKIKKRN